MDADLTEMEGLLESCQTQNIKLGAIVDSKNASIKDLISISEKHERVILSKDNSIEEIEKALKVESRKAKLYKVGMFVGFALIPVTVIFTSLQL